MEPAPGAGIRQTSDRGFTKRLSDQHVGYLVMAHLVDRYDHHEGGCTPFHLSTRVHGLKTQRQERIQALLDRFEAHGFVKATRSDRMAIYECTVVGAAWYKEAARKFMAPFLPRNR